MVDALLKQDPTTLGFMILALVVAIIALWNSLQKATAARVSALEAAVTECMRKHNECEKRNRDLSAAIVDLLENRRPQALAKCRALLSE